MTKVVNGLVKRVSFEELIKDGGPDISDIGLYTRQPATAYRNFFFATQGDGVVLDETLDDKVSKLLAMMQAQVETEKQKTLDRQENTRQQFRGHLPTANNEPELGTGSIPSSSRSSNHSTGFDGAYPSLPPPLPPPGYPLGPVQGLPVPPVASFFNGPRRDARQQVERGRSPARPGEGGPPPLQRPGSVNPPVAIRDGAAVPVAAIRVPSGASSASTRSGGNRSRAAPSTSRSSSNARVPVDQLAARGRAFANERGAASAPPMRRGNRRRRRIDTPEPYSGQ